MEKFKVLSLVLDLDVPGRSCHCSCYGHKAWWWSITSFAICI